MVDKTKKLTHLYDPEKIFLYKLFSVLKICQIENNFFANCLREENVKVYY